MRKKKSKKNVLQAGKELLELFSVEIKDTTEKINNWGQGIDPTDEKNYPVYLKIKTNNCLAIKNGVDLFSSDKAIALHVSLSTKEEVKLAKDKFEKIKAQMASKEQNEIVDN